MSEIKKSEGIEKGSRLEKLALFVGGFEKAQEIISSSLQLERLEELAIHHPFVNLVYFQLISHLNYAMFENDNAPARVTVGEMVNGVWKQKEHGAILIADNKFPTTWDGRLSAMAQAFRHASNKLDDMLSAENLLKFSMSVGTIMQIVEATLRSSRVQQFQGLPSGYGVMPKAGYRLKKLKGGSNPDQLKSREIPETNPDRPPKKWFNKMVKHVAETDVYDPEAVVGDIWYHRLNDSKRREILKRYE